MGTAKRTPSNEPAIKKDFGVGVLIPVTVNSWEITSRGQSKWLENNCSVSINGSTLQVL
jgi:hypothetical protein